jgi:uncharacterized phage protein gp47/JayE
MATFTPRSFETILNDMVAYVQSRSIISDYNIGSAIRSVLEAAALEDDEQYFQMVQLLDLFSITTSAGEDLDRRLADYGLTRASAKPATALGKFYDNTLVKTKIAAEAVAGVTTLVGFDTSRFPTSGYPYVVRIGEGTSRLQNVSVTNNNTTTMTLTLGGGTTFAVEVGDRLAFVTGGSLTSPVAPSAQARTISIGAQVQAAATVFEPARTYATTEPAYIISGNFESNEVIVKAITSGAAGNIGTNRINQFPSSPPFVGAGFASISKASGGVDRETDEEFRSRALSQLQSLSRGTVLALKSSAIGVTDPVSQARVTSSNLVEDFVNNEVILYVDDGTGAISRTKNLPADTLSAPATAGDITLTVTDTSDWPNSGWILLETDGVNAAELVQYQSKFGSTLGLVTAVANNHLAATIIDFVDIITDSAEATQRRFNLNNYPVIRNSERIFIKAPSAAWTLLTDSEYILNRGTGEMQIVDVGGVVAGTQIIAHYTYYTNLIAEVQKVMEGVSDDPVAYPGVKAAGIFLSVEQPILKRITVVASIAALPGYVESDIAPLIQSAIENYIGSLRIGNDVIRSKLIDVAYSVTGLADINIVIPVGNVTVLETELPVPNDASGNSLVSVL